MPGDANSLRTLPAWTGTAFVPKTHRQVPENLETKRHLLPSPFVAVITGASRGIGAATAETFASAGASGLILTARSTQDLERTKEACEAVAKFRGLKITLLSADVAAESSAIMVADAVRREHGGRLDLLINNAGILATGDSAFDKVADIDSFEVEIATSVNYLGRFYMIKHLLPLMLSDPTSARNIVNVSSFGSHIAGPLGYSISNLATNRLSQRVAESYADQGVICCAVHPGTVITDEHRNKPYLVERLKHAPPSESIYLCGAFLLWLVNEKREWLNGRYLDVTWDVDELEKKKDEIVAGDKLKMRLVV